ncbi:MAG: leucine-rich repeat domain-containing protein [Ruminococcus sp.]|nr:leucine-rich repeat domain-containing protein [Ruminococcus sp.]
MKKINKLLSILLALAIVAGVMTAFPLTASATDDIDEPLPYTVSGNCGAANAEDVQWYAFDDNSMAFFGTGAIQNYTPENPAPWFGYEFNTIENTLFARKIAVEYGVTRIGDYSFYLGNTYPYKFYVQLYNIDIANTVTSIGKYAFYGQSLVEEIVIPPSVTHIGENAFKNCSSLKRIVYYGNPADLRWDSDGATDTEFTGNTSFQIHILRDYANRKDEFNARFAYKHITFIADIDNPYALEGEALDRNIAAYYGSVNSRVFGGAAPYIIVGRFNGAKKSVTHGSNGFASCVYINGNYYVLTDITTGELHKVIKNETGKMTGYQEAALSNVKLRISHEYIGTNTVKIIYTLENNTGSPLTNVKVGGTGDIKIGADDKAKIQPLNENGDQVGFYMKSRKDFDKSGENYATLGFIGKNVKIDNTVQNSLTYQNAHYFYGKVDANTNGSAAGSKTVVLLPERIFNMNTSAADAANGKSQADGAFTIEADSGMSYYWEESSVNSNEQKQYAVLFSVYGAKDETSAGSMITDLSKPYHTVTWKNSSKPDDVLIKQVVKDGDPASYPGADPFKASTAQYDYTFSGWSDGTTVYGKDDLLPAVTADITFTAQYSETRRKFFKKHSLSLDGDIGVNYYVDVTVAGLSVDDVKDGTKVKLSFNGFDDPENGYTADAEYTINGSTDYDEKTGCFKAKYSVCAAEMACSVHTTAYISTDNGSTWTEYTDEHDDFSVRDYGDAVLNESSAFSIEYKAENPGQYAGLRDLVTKMLDYGAKAQAAFGVMTDDLANKNFSSLGVSYQMQNVTIEMMDKATAPKSDMRAGVNDLGLTYVGSSVVFLSKSSLRHYYTIADQDTFDTVKSTVGSNFIYHEKDHGIYYEHADIPASKLDETQVFTIGGKTYGFSVLNYCRSVLNSNVPREDKNLAGATYWYNASAKSFFGD